MYVYLIEQMLIASNIRIKLANVCKYNDEMSVTCTICNFKNCVITIYLLVHLDEQKYELIEEYVTIR